MSRSALVLSLALHTGLIAVVGLGWSKMAVHADPGVPGVGISFLPEGAGGSLLIDSPAEANPSDPAAEAEAELVQPPAPVTPTDVTPPVTQEDSNPIAAIPSPNLPAIPSNLESSVPSNKVAEKVSARSKRGGSKPAGATAGTGLGTGTTGTGPGNGGNGFVPPHFLMRYKPPYPQAARPQRLEGTVTLLANIDANGRVTSLKLLHSCGHSVLDRAALDAVRSWRFTAATQNGVPVSAEVEVPVRFEFAG